MEESALSSDLELSVQTPNDSTGQRPSLGRRAESVMGLLTGPGALRPRIADRAADRDIAAELHASIAAWQQEALGVADHASPGLFGWLGLDRRQLRGDGEGESRHSGDRTEHKASHACWSLMPASLLGC